MTAVIVAVAVQKSTVRYEIPFMIGVTILLLIFGLTDNQVSRVEGLIFWVFFILYIMYLYRMTKNHSEEEDNPKKDESVIKLILSVVIGVTIVVWGSDIAVDAATKIAGAAGLSEKFIGLTVIALGTSLPELVTSVAAAIKGKADLAIGNIVGSNIMNILFVVGTTALIVPVPFARGFLIDMIIAIATAALLFICVVRKQRLNRMGGAVMLLGYIAYFVYLCIGK